MKVRMTRRRFFLSAAVGSLGVCGYTWRIEPHWVSITRRDLPVRNLPAALEGRTLAQISDLHVSPQVDSDYLASALRELSELKPDIVAVTGDFVSGASAKRCDEVARVFEHLAPPPLGCFAVLGNHDYGESYTDMHVAELLVARLAKCGVTVLRNEAREVNGLALAGIEDLWGLNFRPADVMPKLRADAPAIVLCHNPDAADKPVWENFRGWILSGHTHGGQCKPPFLRPPLLPVQNKRYTAGAFDLGDGRHMYINRGLGHLLRARFNARPEITVFRLVLESA